MTPDSAAAVLGVELDSSPSDIEAAYRRVARRTHPDRFVGEAQPLIDSHAAEFAEAARARDLLLTRAERGPSVVLPRPHGRALIATWVALLVAAAVLSAWGAPHPLGLAEPILRLAILIGALLGWALTGIRPLLVIGVVAIAATLVMAIVFTTLGALLGTLLMAPSILGLMLAGLVRNRRVQLLRSFGVRDRR